jgi:outer membrane lipoprotein-sorting protein
MKSFYLLLTVLFLQVGTAFSQDAKAQGILDKLSSKMKTMKSFYIEFNATIKNSGGTNENATGKGWVKGNKFYASYGENTIISNGVKTWTVIKEERSVYESDATNSDDGMNPKKLMTIWETGFKNKYIKQDKISGETVDVIDLYPKNPKTADYNTIVIYISKSKNELKKAVMKSNDGTVMTYSVTKFTSNPEVKDTKFAFDKKNYPGYKVIKN